MTVKTLNLSKFKVGTPATPATPVSEPIAQDTNAVSLVLKIPKIQDQAQEPPKVDTSASNSTAVPTVNNTNPNGGLDYLFLQQYKQLEQKLESQLPDVRQELVVIHKALAKDPAIVTILTPEQIATIFKGYSRLSNIELVAAGAKKKGTKADINLFD